VKIRSDPDVVARKRHCHKYPVNLIADSEIQYGKIVDINREASKPNLPRQRDL
jgi:hypothetical protein